MKDSRLLFPSPLFGVCGRVIILFIYQILVELPFCKLRLPSSCGKFVLSDMCDLKKTCERLTKPSGHIHFLRTPLTSVMYCSPLYKFCGSHFCKCSRSSAVKARSLARVLVALST